MNPLPSITQANEAVIAAEASDLFNGVATGLAICLVLFLIACWACDKMRDQ